MALRLGALYDALQQATGISDDKARAAAEEVASYEARMASLESQLRVIQWMLGTVLVIVLIVLGQLVALTWKVSELAVR